ncbi:hypothetical protein BDW02DRAFT_353655 [Decorospora gaudefroyi]|uniref:Uncharacterized protein n=1 Tax=Decorospora gaudefroyi TaxID=184978 RepID=A0A6A5KD82_9PLEO|nr:hypothetical protein BDW02DRAFT_353655 [Decorospora gaudefroyi]
MPPLVRRATLAQRIKAYVDPLDWLMCISEELNTSDWQDFASAWAVWIGSGAHLLFIVAQANSGVSTSPDDDGVFSEVQGPGWTKWIMDLLVLMLAALAFGNAWLVHSKKRHYRLFEQKVDVAPQTPSAKLVRVDSSPASPSPMSFVRGLVQNNAASRAHPVQGRHVWEVPVWDPNPLCLELFCLFNPLHVVLYYLNLPVAPLDPRPSVRVAGTVFIGAGVSWLVWWLQGRNTQQSKDKALINRQTLHEYDSKFVHPALQKPCRDVGIQTISKNSKHDSSVGVRGSSDDLASEVVTYTPTTIINRTFRTNPNASYASQYDPDSMGSTSIARSSHTPSVRPNYSSSQYTSTSTATPADFSSPIRPSHTPNPFRQPPAIPRTSGASDGGYLGINTHAASPLRKSASTNFVDRRASRSRESLSGAGVSPTKREGSPLKRISLPSSTGERVDRDRPLGQAERLGRSSGYGNLGVGRRESGRY